MNAHLKELVCQIQSHCDEFGTISLEQESEIETLSNFEQLKPLKKLLKLAAQSNLTCQSLILKKAIQCLEDSSRQDSLCVVLLPMRIIVKKKDIRESANPFITLDQETVLNVEQHISKLLSAQKDFEGCRASNKILSFNDLESSALSLKSFKWDLYLKKKFVKSKGLCLDQYEGDTPVRALMGYLPVSIKGLKIKHVKAELAPVHEGLAPLIHSAKEAKEAFEHIETLRVRLPSELSFVESLFRLESLIKRSLGICDKSDLIVKINVSTGVSVKTYSTELSVFICSEEFDRRVFWENEICFHIIRLSKKYGFKLSGI